MVFETVKGFKLLLSFVFHVWRFMPSKYVWPLIVIWKSQEKELLPDVHITWQVGMSAEELHILLQNIQTVMEVQSLVWPTTSGRAQHLPSCMASGGAGSSPAFSSCLTQLNILHRQLSYQIMSSSKNLTLIFVLTRIIMLTFMGSPAQVYSLRHGEDPFTSTKTDWQIFFKC